MRWGLPLFALALAIGLGALGPLPGHNPAPRANVTSAGWPALAGFSLFPSAEATTLALPVANPGAAPACQPAARAESVGPAPDHAMLWAASLRGWPEAPSVRAWRHFVAWTKQGARPATACTTQASLG